MSTIKVSPYVAAALLQYGRDNGQRQVYRGDVETIGEIASSATGLSIDAATAHAALGVLVDGELTTVDDDEFAGRFFKIDASSLDILSKRARDQEVDIYEKMREGEIVSPEDLTGSAYYKEFFFFENNPVIRKYIEFGDAWLSKAIDKISSSSLDEGIVVPGDSELNQIASRVVQVDQNSAEVTVVVSALDEVTDAVISNNEIGDILGDDKSAAVAELKAARVLLTADRVRIKPLLRLLGGTLKWLSEKAAGTAVGEAAKHLWKLLYGLFF